MIGGSIPAGFLNNAKGIIFVVDDDDSVRKSLRRLLCSVGFEVETFASGMQFLSRVPPPASGAVVILDLRMPVLNGLDVQRALRERATPMRLIFITAHEDDEAQEAALAAGAIGFVRKPFDQTVLLDLVEHAISQRRLPGERSVPPTPGA